MSGIYERELDKFKLEEEEEQKLSWKREDWEIRPSFDKLPRAKMKQESDFGSFQIKHSADC